MKRNRLIILLLLTVFVASSSIYLYVQDKSQKLEIAMENGLPDIDKKWDLKDQYDFSKYLENLDNNTHYPKYSSWKSGAIFRNYLESIEDTNSSLYNQMQVLQRAGKQKSIASHILTLYTVQHEKEVLYNTELAYLYGIQLQTSYYMQKISKKIWESTKTEDLYYKQKMEGMKMIEESTLLHMKISLHLFKQDFFSTNKIFLKYFKEYMKKIMPLLDGNAQSELKTYIYKEAQSHKDDNSKKLLESIVEGF